MIDLELIEETINELEQGETTFTNCQNLASLYAVKNHFVKNEPKEDLPNLLPQYRQYLEIKKHYQLKEISEEEILISIKRVCTEIKDIIHNLFSNTDTKTERDRLRLLITELFKDLV